MIIDIRIPSYRQKRSKGVECNKFSWFQDHSRKKQKGLLNVKKGYLKHITIKIIKLKKIKYQSKTKNSKKKKYDKTQNSLLSTLYHKLKVKKNSNNKCMLQIFGTGLQPPHAFRPKISVFLCNRNR